MTTAAPVATTASSRGPPGAGTQRQHKVAGDEASPGGAPGSGQGGTLHGGGMATTHGSSAINPFTIPADEDIFRLREEDRRAKAEARAAALQAAVADKTTSASRMQATTTEDARAFLAAYKRDVRQQAARNKAAATAMATSLAAGAIGGGGEGGVGRRRDKETMADFIEKKREIFLLQMSLDTKRAEIKKLEERARQREEALKKSEQMLEEDALRFDAFLKENDEKVQEAIKRAEVEAKHKADKLLEIKRLATATAALRSEMNKYEEQLEDCRKYREFLDGVTPPEFFEAQAAARAARAEAARAAWVAACEDVRRRKDAAVAAKARAEHEYANARTQQEAERAERALKDSAARLKEAAREKEPPPPAEPQGGGADGPALDDGMFFTDPAQLLAVYQELEESNLFYIQNAQETEEALEELRAKQRDTRVRMDAEVANLKAQVEALQEAAAAAQARTRRLRARASEDALVMRLTAGALGTGGGGSPGGGAGMGGTGGTGATATANSGGTTTAATISLDALSAKVAAVYVRCGFDADKSVGTLQMLTNIESKLEEYLGLVDGGGGVGGPAATTAAGGGGSAGLTPEFVEGVEKAREKERRRVARDDKLSAAAREHEARMARALERASAPVFKKQGKPLMARSAPPKKKVVATTDDRADREEAELEAYLARDMV